MARTSFTGALRQYGNNKSATPAVFLACIQFDFDPTQASASTGKTLPKGAIPVAVQNIDGGATGGTSPTVDIGTQADSDGFANELDADSHTGFTHNGSLLGQTLSADTLIYAGVGASAATGGTVKASVYYIMSDDGGA